ncbi:hypothetical protein SRHO_G00338920 [Serrasalmus rhombeus]
MPKSSIIKRALDGLEGNRARKSLVKPLRTAHCFSVSTSLHGSAAGQREQLDSWTDRQDIEAETVERNDICYHGRDGVAKQRPNTPTCIHALMHTYTHMCAAARHNVQKTAGEEADV